MKDTLTVTYYAGPGVGKSTTNALSYGRLKQRGWDVEMSHEYAKELVWEDRQRALRYQPAIIGKQLGREHRLRGQVDAILTDTSTLFALVFGGPEQGVTPAFEAWLVDAYKRERRLDFFLERDYSREYMASGRRQKTLEEAAEADDEIRNLLHRYEIPFTTIAVDAGPDTYIDKIVGMIESTLQGVGQGKCAALEGK
jgi:hypothetical protein